MRFRTATDDDAPRVRQIAFAALEEHGLAPDPEGADADLFDLERAYRGGLFEVLVDDDGVVQGSFGLMPLEGGACELRKMYFAPAARGRGLGRQALARAIDAARRLGFRRVELETAAPLKRAMALYEAAGFRRIDRPHMVSRCDRAYALDLEPAR